MWYAVVAIAVGVAIGFVRGGRFTNLATRTFRAIPLFVVGVALQLATEVIHFPRAIDVTLVLASYAALAAFALRNLHLAGMGVFALGLVLNIAPIAVNQGMPVRATAVVDAGIVRRSDEIARLRFGGKRHLERPGDHLILLSDIIPDWLFHEVLSFGDLVMSVGIAALIAHLLVSAPSHAAVADEPAPAIRKGGRTAPVSG
jgi:hypothetical protein